MNLTLAKRAFLVVTGLALAIAALPAPAAAAPSPVDSHLPQRLVHEVNPHAIHHTLEALQRFADHSGHSRAAYTQGYADSVAYVQRRLERAGFEVTVQTYNYDRRVVDGDTLAAGSAHVAPFPIINSLNTPAGGVTGKLMAVPESATPGCTAADYAGGDYHGAIVLVLRGVCTFAVKQQVAFDQGAVAAIVYNNVDGPGRGAITNPLAVRLPVGLVSNAEGVALKAAAGSTATLDLRTHIESTQSRNIIAQTRTGRTDNVVLAGSQLDSEDNIPGIDDSGTAAAALLDLALHLGSHPRVANAVRFAFWGTEWTQAGSKAYVSSLDAAAKANIAAYLNFDLIGSTNAGYFVFDGDNSDSLDIQPRPAGSAQIEKVFQDYYGTLGIATDGTNWDTNSDHLPFLQAGIPTGGIYSGAYTYKTAAQAAKWGGQPGAAFDPCHQQVCDDIHNVDMAVVARNAKVMAYAVSTLALSTTTVNGK